MEICVVVPISKDSQIEGENEGNINVESQKETMRMTVLHMSMVPSWVVDPRSTAPMRGP